MGFRFSNLTSFHRAFHYGRRSLNGRRLGSPAEQHQNHSRTTSRCHVGHSHHGHELDSGDADRIFRLGLAADVALAVGKAVTGYLSGSTAIVADAAHSVSDIVLSGVALVSFRAAKAPKDEEHPYGHGKFESLGTLGISSMLLLTAGGIAWHAIDVLQGLLTSSPDIVHNILQYNYHNHDHGGHHHGIDLEHPVLALSMTITAISVKEGLYWITKRAGERVGSGLMKANAWHHRSDAISSVVALIGVGGAIIGVPILDPFAGLVVSGMILKVGIETGYQSVLELVDAAIEPSVLEPIRQTIIRVEGVKGCHRLRGRKAGTSLYLDVHVEVDPFLSVSAAHDIGETVRHRIQKFHDNVSEVFIHIDPSYLECSSELDQRTNLKGMEQRNPKTIPRQQDVETIISGVISSHFSKHMSLEHVMLHSLQGKLLLQVHVSMSPKLMIRDAMDIAKEAEKEILKADSSLNQVSIHLRLSHPTSQPHVPVVIKEGIHEH